MAKDRVDLHYMLVDMLGSSNVYFQPPESLKLKYPAIIYGLSDVPKLDADNDIYSYNKEYQIIVVDEDPDSEIAEKFYALPRCRFDRQFASDNLNHFVFNYYH